MMNKHTWVFLKRKWTNIKSYIGWDDYLAILSLWVGVLGFIEGPVPYIPVLTDIYLGIRSEMVGIGITVLIIGNASEAIIRREEKKRLILQMGSPDNGFAIEAVRQLDKFGWISDGSLKNSLLQTANLQNVTLIDANLVGACLNFANLIDAYIIESNLTRATLVGQLARNLP